MKAIPKDYRPLVRQALEQGWQVKKQKTHLVLSPPAAIPGKTTIVVARTPNKGWRAIRNTKAEFRRAGVVIE